MDASLTHVLSLIDQEYAELPSGKDLAEKLKGKMIKTQESPPIAELEFLIQSAGCNLEDNNGCMVSSLPVEVARSILFNPCECQIELYPLLLRRVIDDEACTEAELAQCTAASKIQPLLWALVYLVHRKLWRFLEVFVLSGGLIAVSEMIGDNNLYVRGQAIEIMLSITDCDVNDWFKKAGDNNTRLLHTRLLSCYKDDNFLKNLILNRTHSYPGGSMRCLQILAFFLSWMRAEYSNNENIVLNNALLAVFYQWTRADSGDGESHSSSSNEIELAETLLKDFEKVESIKDLNLEKIFDLQEKDKFIVHGLSDLAEEFLTEGEIFRREFDSRLKDGRKEMRRAGMPDMDSVNKMKDDANALFKSKKYSDALALYEKALENLLKVEEKTTDKSKAEMEATLHFNRASTFWKLSQESSTSSVSSSSSSNVDDIDAIDLDESLSDKIFELQRCEQACESALDINPDHIKAFFRLINAIIALGRPKEALQRIEMLKKTSSNCRNDDEDREKILAELTRKCNASLILRAGSIQTAMESGDPDVITSTILSSGAIINPKTAKVLAKLNMRRQRENESVDHAWKDWEPPTEQSATYEKRIMDTGEDIEDNIPIDPSTTASIFKSLDVMGVDDGKCIEGVNYSDSKESKSGDVLIGISNIDVKNKREKSKAETKKDLATAKSKKKSEFLKMVAGL